MFMPIALSDGNYFPVLNCLFHCEVLLLSINVHEIRIVGILFVHFLLCKMLNCFDVVCTHCHSVWILRGENVEN